MKTIHEVLEMTTQQVVKAATEILCKNYKKVLVHKDNFVYAVGTGPICIVAHMDTVRDPQIVEGVKPRYDYHVGKPFQLEQRQNVLTNVHGVLGADDRAGVFACIELMRRCKRDKLLMPSIILTNGEESGGKGVGVFVATEAFEKYDKGATRLFVEMDRQSCNEWVSYGSALPKEVTQYVESFGFNKANGSYSDIADLQEAYLIPSVNLSIGYYQQHSANERLHIDEMHMTINRVFSMFKNPIDQLYPVAAKVKYVPASHGSYYNNNHSSREEGNAQGKKGNGPRKSGTTGTGTTVWTDPVGMESIDMVLDHITQGGFCPECGYDWTECDCTEMFVLLQSLLNHEELTFLKDKYLDKEDPMHTQIDDYFKGLSEDKLIVDVEVEISKDPFHVGKDGERVVVVDEVKSDQGGVI